MKMTFQQYIDNPMGKKNAVFSQRELFKNLYTEKFDKVFLREAGKINYTLYIDSKTDRYCIHLKIPSETVKNFYYDAVILFYSDDPVAKASNNLTDYSVKFFSNDPAFVFTYLHVFLTNDLFIEDLKNKSPKLAIKKEAKERNPYGVPGYSKVLYFAFLFMKSKNLFVKSIYEGAKKYSARAIQSDVEHADKKIADRQRLGEEQARQERKEKEKEQKKTRTITRSNTMDNASNMRLSKTTGVVNKVGGVNTVSRVKTVKRTKRR